MKLPPIVPPLVAAPLRARPAMAASEATPRPVSPREPGDQLDPSDWRDAYLRQRERDPSEREPVLPVLPTLARATHEPAPEAMAVRSVAPTPTSERLAVMRLLAEPNPSASPVARSWQVELPAAGPGWQLHVEQAQPQAPLNLELRVPQVAQAQARQQLSDLDKRLREAGHDVLRPRVRDARPSKRSRPVDEVEP
jgi:hypothetical protein